MNSKLIESWNTALSIMKNNFSEATFSTFIKPTKPLYMEGNFIVLKAKDNIAKETIEIRHLQIITETLREIFSEDVYIKIISPEELETKFNEIDNNFVKSTPNNNHKTNINPKYTFDTFVKGKSNELAYAVSLAVANSPGKSYNPLFLYGGVGLGKTHLMHSIGNFILKENENKKVLYCTSETFTNELINSIKDRKNQEFRNKYRNIDILLIDDIQFLAEKEGTQEEFFHTFNSLYEINKQIVISSDQPPREIKSLENRLRSRFACGVQFDITLPDFETRTAILEKKAEFDQIKIPKEVTKFIAKNIVSNIRDLEGALNKVTAYSKLTKKEINLELTELALKDIIINNEKQELSVEIIQEIVSKYYNITINNITSKKRTQNFTYPRHVAMYFCRKLLDVSLPKIGNRFGGRDHSTVIHGAEKIEREIETNVKLKREIEELEKTIKSE